MNLKQFLFTLLISITFVTSVRAEACDSEDIDRLKNLAEHVDIAYSVRTEEAEGDIYKDIYTIRISNLKDELYAEINNGNLISKMTNDNNSIDYVNPGEKTIKIYSTQCNTKLKTTTLYLLYYNDLYENEICKDYRDRISTCKEWTKRKIYLSDVETQITGLNKKKQRNKSKILNTIKSNYIYILIIILLSLIIGMIVFINHKRRNKLE